MLDYINELDYLEKIFSGLSGAVRNYCTVSDIEPKSIIERWRQNKLLTEEEGASHRVAFRNLCNREIDYNYANCYLIEIMSQRAT